MARQTVERCGWTGDLEGVIARTFYTGTARRTQLRHVTDETIKRYVDKLETLAQTHVLADDLHSIYFEACGSVLVHS